MEKHPPAYLSPSRLSCYAYCPAEFHKRYILKQDDPPGVERMFGTSVHKGLEALFKDEDAELAFLRDWRAAKQTLQAAELVFGSGLDARGLEIIDMVSALGLTGESERFFMLTAPDFIIPFLGYVDLWSEGHIYDFKTTGRGWSQDKANEQIFQPAIYSQAHADVFGSIPKFTFVVLSRITGPVQLFDGTRTGDQILEAFDQARQIHEAIEAKQFDCRCGRHAEEAA